MLSGFSAISLFINANSLFCEPQLCYLFDFFTYRCFEYEKRDSTKLEESQSAPSSGTRSVCSLSRGFVDLIGK